MTPRDQVAEVKALLRDIAHLDRHASVPDAVEERVLRAWDERANESSTRPVLGQVRWKWAVVGTGVAACLAAGVSVCDRRQVTPQPPVPSTPMLALDSYLWWLDDDPSSLQVVHLRATRATLSSMGVALPGVESDGPLYIELVVGPDGARRGARLVLPTAQEEL